MYVFLKDSVPLSKFEKDKKVSGSKPSIFEKLTKFELEGSASFDYDCRQEKGLHKRQKYAQRINNLWLCEERNKTKQLRAQQHLAFQSGHGFWRMLEEESVAPHSIC